MSLPYFRRFLLGLLAIAAVPTLWLAPLHWFNLGAVDRAIVASACLAFGLGLVCLRLLRTAAASRRTLLLWMVSLAVFGSWFALLVFALIWLPALVPADTSLPLLATTALTGALALLLVAADTRWIPSLALGAVAIAALGTHLVFRVGWLPRPLPPSVHHLFIDSSLYRLELTTYRGWLPPTSKSGGGVARWDNGVLIADGDGRLAVVRDLDSGGAPSITPLRYRVPINSNEFERDARELLAGSPGRSADTNRFRVSDVLTEVKGDAVTVYASHHYWNSTGKCFSLRVSSLSGDRRALESGALDAQWQTVFETQPCITLNIKGPRGLPFDGWENGGRMAVLNERELLVTVGDHGFDGVDRLPALPQDPSSGYGKIWRVPLDGQPPRLYSLGHRNPQGLLIDGAGTVWETEHGPRGGDELNRIVEGGNYGWPLVTLGADYGSRNWPLNATPGRHDSFIAPVYAFVPSVGISNLIAAPEAEFPAWRGDLLVGSLVGQTLFRVRLHQGAVQFAEGMYLGNRVRDMTTTVGGALLIWSDDGSFAVMKHRDETTAERLIATCRGCHSTVRGQPSFSGPDLSGLVNRRVASVDEFNYSPAMRSLGGRWTPQRLDQFLSDPHGMVPGTTMNYGGIPRREDRQAIIDFLKNPPIDFVLNRPKE